VGGGKLPQGETSWTSSTPLGRGKDGQGIKSTKKGKNFRRKEGVHQGKKKREFMPIVHLGLVYLENWGKCAGEREGEAVWGKFSG